MYRYQFYLEVWQTVPMKISNPKLHKLTFSTILRWRVLWNTKQLPRLCYGCDKWHLVQSYSMSWQITNDALGKLDEWPDPYDTKLNDVAIWHSKQSSNSHNNCIPFVETHISLTTMQAKHVKWTRLKHLSWWRHQMETFSALLVLCAGNSPVLGEFPAQRPVTRGFDVFFDLRPNKRLSKQSRGWWFETP